MDITKLLNTDSSSADNIKSQAYRAELMEAKVSMSPIDKSWKAKSLPYPPREMNPTPAKMESRTEYHTPHLPLCTQTNPPVEWPTHWKADLSRDSRRLFNIHKKTPKSASQQHSQPPAPAFSLPFWFQDTQISSRGQITAQALFVEDLDEHTVLHGHPTDSHEARKPHPNKRYPTHMVDAVRYWKEDCNLSWPQVSRKFNERWPGEREMESQCFNSRYYRDNQYPVTNALWQLARDKEGNCIVFCIKVRQRNNTELIDAPASLIEKHPQRVIDTDYEFVNATDRERARAIIMQDEEDHKKGCLSGKCFLVVAIMQAFLFTVSVKGKWRKLILAAEKESQRLVSPKPNETWQILVGYWTWISVL